MWIEALPSGKYKARERYKDLLTGKVKIVSVTLDKDTAKARKAAAEQLRVRVEKLQDACPDQEITLSELCSLYLAHQQNTKRPQTYQRDQSVIPLVVAALGNDVKANKLSARHIIQSLEKAKSKNTTRNTYLGHIKKMLRWAYQNDYVENILYLDKVKPWPDNRKERIEDKYLTSEELKALLDGMEIYKWKLLTQFLALSGLRIGEAMALQDSDVGECIIVNKTLVLRDGSVSDTAKTDAGNREVFIQEELLPVIKALRKEKQIDQFEKGYRSTKFLFDFAYPAYDVFLKRQSAKIINHRISPHALRHTHVSLLAEQGVSLDVISRRVGHEGSDVTKKIYLHITEKQKERDREKVDKIRLLG